MLRKIILVQFKVQRLEVLLVLLIVWDVMPYQLLNYRRFGGSWCLKI